ncbi:MAG TPA: extracellular solute-binding protein [Trebonia sp.]|jgi:multiple sugar transport system substrate-binding protein
MMRYLSNRRRGAFLGAVAVACLAVGCAAPGAAPGAGSRPAAGAAGTTTVTILSGADTSVSPGDKPVRPDDSGMYAELVDWWNRYEEPVTKIHVVLDTVSGAATAEHSEMLADAESGDTRFDIYNLDNEWVPEFAAGHFIRSLRGQVNPADFLPGPKDSGIYDGQLYAAPFTTDVGLLYYRKDLVSAARVAKLSSFRGLAGLAEQVMDEHPGITTGYDGQFSSYEGLTVNVLEIIDAAGADAFRGNGTIGNAEAVTQGLTQLSDWTTSGSTGVIPAAELGYTESQSVADFAAGDALFMRNWPIYYQQLVTAKGKGSGQLAQDIAVAPLPYPSVLGGQDLAIAQASPHSAAALQVIKYLTSAEAERCLFAVAGFPATRADAYADDNTLPTGYNTVNGPALCGSEVGPSVKIGTTIRDAVDKAFLRPRTRYYTEFSAIIQDQVPPLLRQGTGSTSLLKLETRLAKALNAAATGLAPRS